MSGRDHRELGERVELEVDTEAGTVVLRDPSELTRFSVVIPDPGEADRAARLELVDRVLAATAAGSVGVDGVARVRPDAVRRLAAARGVPSAAWDEDFADMVATAASRGWIADDGAIRAHIDWRG